MNSQTIRLGASGLMASLCLLAGCADFPIYSPARDKQGQEAKKAWSEVDLKTKFAVARENLATLRAKELETEDTLHRARRDQMIRAMATGGTVETKLVKPTEKALGDLAGSVSQAANWSTARKAEITAAKPLVEARVELSEIGVELPPCDALKLDKERAALQAYIDNGGFEGSTVLAWRTTADKACANPKLTQTTTTPVVGSLGATLAELKEARTELEGLRSRTRAERNEYTAALEAHDKAVKALQTDPKAEVAVQKAAARVKKAIDVLYANQDVFSVKFLAQERSAALDHFLATVADTKAAEAPPKGTTKAELALLLFPKLYDDTKKALNDAKLPTLAPLVLQKDYEKIQLDAATRDITAQEARIALLEQKLQIQANMTDQFLNASRAFKPKFQAQSLSVALADQKPATPEDPAFKEKNALLLGVAQYLDAQTRLQADVRKIEYQLDSAMHERALAYAEANAAQWQTLIGGSVDQLSVYGASGIKPEMLVALLNSVTLLWIGVGVN